MLAAGVGLAGPVQAFDGTFNTYQASPQRMLAGFEGRSITQACYIQAENLRLGGPVGVNFTNGTSFLDIARAGAGLSRAVAAQEMDGGVRVPSALTATDAADIETRCGVTNVSILQQSAPNATTYGAASYHGIRFRGVQDGVTYIWEIAWVGQSGTRLVNTRTPVPTEPTLSLAAVPSATAQTVGRNYSFTVTPSVSAAATTGTLTLTATLPSGQIPVSYTGSSWTCLASGTSLTCTYPPVIAAGASGPPLTVTVTPVAAQTGGFAQTFTLSGGGATSPATATAATVVVNGQPVTSPNFSTLILPPNVPANFTPVTRSSGGTANFRWEVSPPLPAGLTLDPDTGVVSGTPNTVTSTRAYTFTVRDARGATSARSVDIGVGFAPVVDAVSPDRGSLTGGTPVTITGSNFTGVTRVRFGSSDATGVTFVSDTEVRAVSPAGTGAVNVSVTTGIATSASSAQFTYGQAPVASVGTVSALPTYSTTSTTTEDVAGYFTHETNVYLGASGTDTTATVNGMSFAILPDGRLQASWTAGFHGTSSVLMRAVNSFGSATARFEVTVGSPLLSASLSGSGAVRGQALSGYSIQTTGGLAPYRCATTPATGALPSGVSINADCTLSGTPTQDGTFTFTLDVTDSSTGPSGANPMTMATGTLSLVVAAPQVPTITAGYATTTIRANGSDTARLEITITNPNGFPLSGLSVAPAALPAGLTASLVGASTTCGGTISYVGASRDVGLSGGSLGANASCVVGLDLSTRLAGRYTTTTGAVSATETGAGGTATTPTALTATAVPASITILSGSGQTTPISTAFAQPLVVEVRDFGNAPLAGVDVDFSVPGGGSSAGLTIVNRTTNAAGQATVTATANAVVGSFKVTASVTGVPTAVEFDLTNLPAVPGVTGVSPPIGTAAGGTRVTISGTDFTNASKVSFGTTDVLAASFVSRTDSQIVVDTPARTAGLVNVSVTTPSGTSADNGTNDDFRYTDPPTVALSFLQTTIPADGTSAATLRLTLTNPNPVRMSEVQLLASFPTGIGYQSGSVVANSCLLTAGVSADRLQIIRARLEANQTCTVDVQLVSTTQGTYSITTGSVSSDLGNASGVTTPTALTVLGLPVVTQVQPNVGTTAGGVTVTIRGTNFTNATRVNFGGTAVQSADFRAASDTEIVVLSPPGSAGTVNISVTTPAQTSAENGTNDDFTYGIPPTLNGFTLSSSVPYNPGGAAPTSINVATLGNATGSPSGYAITTPSANGATVSVTAGGVVSYTPATGARGTDTFAVTAGNAFGSSSAAIVTVEVVDPVFTASIPAGNGLVGTALTRLVTLSGGVAPYSNFSATGLPPGLSISASGEISGTPTAAGTYASIVVTATDSSVPPFTGNSAAITMVIDGVAQVITFPVPTNPDPSKTGFVPGDSVRLAATASSGLSVQYSALTPATCSVTPDGLLSFTAPGACSVAADQPGNTTVAPAARVTISLSILGVDAVAEAELVTQMQAARARALVLNQPDLIPLLPGAASDDLTDVTVSSKGAAVDLIRVGGPVWFRFSGSLSRQATGARDHYFQLSLGSHVALGPQSIIGLMATVDTVRLQSSLGRADGKGWLIGPYLVTRIGDTALTFEVRALSGRTTDQIMQTGGPISSAGGSRSLVMAKLSGEYEVNERLTLNPSLSIAEVRQTSDPYVAAGVPIPTVRNSYSQQSLGLDMTYDTANDMGPLTLRGGLGWFFTEETVQGSGAGLIYKLGIAQIIGKNSNLDIDINGQSDLKKGTDQIGLSLRFETRF